MNFITSIIDLVFQVYILLIMIRAVMSWVPHNPFNPLIELLSRVTEPVLGPVRKGLPPNSLGLDASPFVAIILLWLLWQGILGILNFI